jgi:hypothetical protein
MKKVTIYQIDAAGKLCKYHARTLSYIKAKRVMYQELRHQVKIHKISEKLKTGINIRKFLSPPPPPFKEKKKAKQQKHAYTEKKTV